MRLPIIYSEDDDDFLRRPRPAEYLRGVGWVEDGQRRKRVKKPHYHFIWPKDGKNGGKWGRTKDILTGKGPDIHVTVGADKMDYMFHRQRRSTWARHTNLDDRHHDPRKTLEVPWAKTIPRRAGLRYDFLESRYRRPDANMVTDARWMKGVSTKELPYPEQLRRMDGNWWTLDPRPLVEEPPHPFCDPRGHGWQDPFGQPWPNPWGQPW